MAEISKVINCPNCGAPITTDICQYCGTVFLDFAAIQANKPSYIKFRVDNNGVSYICLMKLTVDNLEFKISSDTIDAMDYKNRLLTMVNNRTLEVNLHGYATSNEGESLMTVIKEEN